MPAGLPAAERWGWAGIGFPERGPPGHWFPGLGHRFRAGGGPQAPACSGRGGAGLRRRRAGSGAGAGAGLPPPGEWGRDTGVPGEGGHGEPNDLLWPRRVPEGSGVSVSSSRPCFARGCVGDPRRSAWSRGLWLSPALVAVPGVKGQPGTPQHPSPVVGEASTLPRSGRGFSQTAPTVPGDPLAWEPGTCPLCAPTPGLQRCLSSASPSQTCGDFPLSRKPWKHFCSTRWGLNSLEAKGGLVRRSLWWCRLGKKKKRYFS